jgi:hypothetical protein
MVVQGGGGGGWGVGGGVGKRVPRVWEHKYCKGSGIAGGRRLSDREKYLMGGKGVRAMWEKT